MSDTTTNPAEPTENQGGGTTAKTTQDATSDTSETAAAEPTENQGGGSVQ